MYFDLLVMRHVTSQAAYVTGIHSTLADSKSVRQILRGLKLGFQPLNSIQLQGKVVNHLYSTKKRESAKLKTIILEKGRG
jgi:hypothetical protein